MLNFKRLFFQIGLFALALSLFSSCQSAKDNRDEEYVVILSLDAFRWDYSDLVNTPTLNAIAAQGVKAKALIPCYPSKTFPNHYSIATGLYPDHHGIVSNSFYDKELGFYSIGDRNAVENAAFYGGEPFWLTAEKQGLTAFTYFWVGSEAPVGGQYPSRWKEYDQSVSFESRIDTVIHWLSLPKESRPRLVAWYFHEPDHTAHRDGATGERTMALVEQLDSLVGVFVDRLNELPYADKINFIVVSDHGMTDISPLRYTNLLDYVDRDWFHHITGSNPLFSLQPKEEYREKALQALRSVEHLKVWERNEIPERLHYGTNPRILDIIVEPELGYSVGFTSNAERYSGGTHGYDNAETDMHGILYAMGPSFKKGYAHKAIENVNVYGIITHILGLTPAPYDGKWEDVKDLFKE